MIEIKNVTMDFSENKKNTSPPSLKDVSLDIPEGCIYGFLGSNGAGKSTLMRLISGIYPPTAGEITVDGEPVFDNPKAKEKIFFVNDETTQFTGYTPEELSAFYAGAYSGYSEEIFRKVMTALKLPTDKKLSTFSKGMKRQTVVALALAAQTKYLLFDEAFDGLDPAMRRMVKNIITDEIIDRGATLILSSHNLTEISELCDHAMLIHEGELVFSSELDELRGGFTKMQLVVRDPALEDEAVLRSRIESLGLKVLDISSLGSIRQLIVKASEEEAKEKLSAISPELVEGVPLTLEEIFIYELEARGYGSAELTKEDS
ncbi:ABC-2 type transport system ATP-binding protein [Ruminococcaceae bacterium FB2012]|nr:ABC-2 type transport system ATP-binding protein [Ruminococcaceae bacterium FB2012]